MENKVKEKKQYCLECGELKHEGACNPELKRIWTKALTLQEVFDLPEGGRFLFRDEEAEVKWQDSVRFLIAKGDPKASPPLPDIYFRSNSVCFEIIKLKKLVTLTSSYPFPKTLKLRLEFERI